MKSLSHTILHRLVEKLTNSKQEARASMKKKIKREGKSLTNCPHNTYALNWPAMRGNRVQCLPSIEDVDSLIPCLFALLLVSFVYKWRHLAHVGFTTCFSHTLPPGIKSHKHMVSDWPLPNMNLVISTNRKCNNFIAFSVWLQCVRAMSNPAMLAEPLGLLFRTLKWFRCRPRLIPSKVLFRQRAYIIQPSFRVCEHIFGPAGCGHARRSTTDNNVSLRTPLYRVDAIQRSQ